MPERIMTSVRLARLAVSQCKLVSGLELRKKGNISAVLRAGLIRFVSQVLISYVQLLMENVS